MGKDGYVDYARRTSDGGPASFCIVSTDSDDRGADGAFVPPSSDHFALWDAVFAYFAVFADHSKPGSITPPGEICNAAGRVNACGAQPLHGFGGDNVDAAAVLAGRGDQAHVLAAWGE